MDEGFALEVIDEGKSLELLGTALNLDDATRNEIDSRIAYACRMFWSMKLLLMNQKVSINRRLRLFNATVGSCATWCCESWTPRAKELDKLETARRSMLRKIMAVRRNTEEDWIEWIRKATHSLLDRAERAGVREWTRYHHERKWMWAGHVARSSANSWLYRIGARASQIRNKTFVLYWGAHPRSKPNVCFTEIMIVRMGFVMIIGGS